MITLWDFSILNWIQTYVTNPTLDRVMAVVTTLGNKGFLWIVIAVILLCTKKYRKIGIAIGLALACGTLAGEVILKNIVARLRPFQLEEFALLIHPPRGYSFPSGHTLSSFAAATAIFAYDRRWGTAALVFAAVMGFSRLYLYVHFPTDVLVGALLGVLFGIVGYLLTESVFRRLERKHNV